jgi:hypothetical protein
MPYTPKQVPALTQSADAKAQASATAANASASVVTLKAVVAQLALDLGVALKRIEQLEKQR